MFVLHALCQIQECTPESSIYREICLTHVNGNISFKQENFDLFGKLGSRFAYVCTLISSFVTVYVSEHSIYDNTVDLFAKLCFGC